MAHKDQAQRTQSQIRRRNTLQGRLKSLLANARSHSKPRGHNPPTITIEDLILIWKQQKGICAYTGWTMSTQTGSPLVVSIERVDIALGYDKDNCVLVCWVANNARGTSSREDFLKLCRAVTEHHTGVSSAL